MTSSVKSGAALRLRRPAEPIEVDAAYRTGAHPASHEASRENLYRFPSIGIPPQRPSAPPAQADEPSLARLDDLAAELETALMNDLNQVAPFWGDEAPALPPARPGQLRLPLGADDIAPVAPTSKDEVPHSDRLAVELLLARGRAAVPAPAPVAPRIEPRALEESLADELAERLSAAVDELKVAEGETVVPVLLDAPPPRRAFAGVNRPLVAMTVATLIVAGGALLTVQSLTANPDVPAAADIGAAATLATGSVAPVDAPVPAVAPKQSYERAAEDQALSEAPQLRGADLMLPTTLSPRAGSAGGTAPVDSSVRAAYAMPAPAADATLAAAAVTAEAGGTPLPDAPAATSPDDGAVAAAAASAEPAVAAPTTQPAASIADLQAGAARVTGGVRLRGNPDNSAPTVGYLKPGAEVRVVQCKGWCEVVAGDKRGFVFKRFLAAL